MRAFLREAACARRARGRNSRPYAKGPKDFHVPGCRDRLRLSRPAKPPLISSRIRVSPPSACCGPHVAGSFPPVFGRLESFA